MEFSYDGTTWTATPTRELKPDVQYECKISKVSISNLPNISPELKNNRFTIEYPNGEAFVKTIPTGCYDRDELLAVITKLINDPQITLKQSTNRDEYGFNIVKSDYCTIEFLENLRDVFETELRNGMMRGYFNDPDPREFTIFGSYPSGLTIERPMLIKSIEPHDARMSYVPGTQLPCDVAKLPEMVFWIGPQRDSLPAGTKITVSVYAVE